MAEVIKINGKPFVHGGKEVYSYDMNGVIKDVKTKERSITIVGSTEDRDRHGDVVLVSGWILDNYVKNPVFLWGHNYMSVPIGAAKRIVRRRSPKLLEFTIRFPSEEGIYPLADLVFNLYKDRIVNACSVGFIPLKWEEIKEEEKPKPNERRFWNPMRYLKQELLELSGVSVPANPNAIVSESKVERFLKGQLSKDELETEWKEDVLSDLNIQDVEVEDEELKIFQVPDTIELTAEEVEKPYPNEHACRLNPPSKYDRFARKKCAQKHDDKCIDVIYGIKDNKSEIQALRYNKDVWTVDDAREHCKGRGGTFEAAKEEQYDDVLINTVTYDSETGYAKEASNVIDFSTEFDVLKEKLDKVVSLLSKLDSVETTIETKYKELENRLVDMFEGIKTDILNSSPYDTWFDSSDGKQDKEEQEDECFEELKRTIVEAMKKIKGE